jgi:multidrug resistance efflux pump
MKSVGRFGFAAIWIGAALCAAAMFYFWNVNADYLGIVETRNHKLGSPAPGRIRELLVSLGDEVRANQLLARLDASDLETESAWIKEELANLETMVAADKRRYALEYEKLLLQRDASASGMNQRRADLEAKRAEIEALDTQIRPMVEAEKSGLGRPRELPDLLIRRDALTRYVKEGKTGLSRNNRTGHSQPTANELTEAESVVLSMLRRRLDRISDLNLRLKIIETSITNRNVVAPCDGRVVTINYLPGDAVDKFTTIIKIEESKAAFVDVYIPEGVKAEPSLGDRVAVYSKSSRVAKTHGSVTFIDPGYSVVPERLWFRKIPYYARKFRVRLEDGHNLVPGESTQVELLHNGQVWPKARAQERPAPKKAAPAPRPKSSAVQTRTRESLALIEAPEKLRKLTAIEPSGIAWLQDIGRYVIVSDDTGRGRSKHAPAVLLMDRQGKMEPAAAYLHGIDQVNDLESIAPAPDGSLYLISSQNLNKKGKRPLTRQQILKVNRSGRDFHVAGAADLYSALVSSYSAGQVRGLGLGETDKAGALLMNIEGSAFFEGDLLLGLKQPRPAAGAVILRLKNPDRLIKTQALEPGQLTRFGQVDLRTPDGRAAAISDMVADERGELLVLSTVPNVSDEEQVGGMFRLRRTKSNAFEVAALFTFPQLKPEGLCALGNDQYTVVFDTDDKLPFYYLNVGVARS